MPSTLEYRTLKSTFSGAIVVFIGVLQSIILVPLFLNLWGKDKYGVWLSIISFISLVKTIEIGHQNFIGNEFIKFFHKDKFLAKKTLESAFWVSIILGGMEFIIFSIFLFNYSSFIFGNASINNFSNSYLYLSLLFFVFVFCLFGSIGGLLVKIILPIGLFARFTNLGILHKAAELIVIFLVVVLKLKLSILFFGLGLVNLIISIIVFYYVKKVLPDFFPWWGNMNWKLGLRNYIKSIVLTINSFADQLNSSSIIIFITRVMSVAVIPVFTTIRSLTNVVLQITSIVVNPLSPELIRFHSKNEYDKLVNVIETNLFIGGILVNLPFLLITPFIKFFFYWWTSGELIFDYPLFCLLTLSVTFVNIGRPFITLLSGINDLRFMSIISITRVLITITIGFILIKPMGLMGIGLAVLLSELISSLLLPIILVSKRLGLTFHLLKAPFIWYSISQIFLLAFYYLISEYLIGILDIAFLICFFIIMLIISFYQWNLLDIEVKKRLVNLKSLFFASLISRLKIKIKN